MKKKHRKWGKLDLAYNALNSKTRDIKVLLKKKTTETTRIEKKGEEKTGHTITQKIKRTKMVRYPRSYAMVKPIKIAGEKAKTHYKLRKEDQWKAEFKTKQDLKYYYGRLRQKDLEKAIKKARTKKINLITWLEKRLDVILVRTYFAQSIYQARNLIKYGFIKLNGEVSQTIDRSVKPGSIIETTHPEAPIFFYKARLLSKTQGMSSSAAHIDNKSTNLIEKKEQALKQLIKNSWTKKNHQPQEQKGQIYKEQKENFLKKISQHNAKALGPNLYWINYKKAIYLRDNKIEEIKQGQISISKLKQYINQK